MFSVSWSKSKSEKRNGNKKTKKHEKMSQSRRSKGGQRRQSKKKSIVSGCKSGKSFASFTLAASVILLSHRHFYYSMCTPPTVRSVDGEEYARGTPWRGVKFPILLLVSRTTHESVKKCGNFRDSINRLIVEGFHKWMRTQTTSRCWKASGNTLWRGDGKKFCVLHRQGGWVGEKCYVHLLLFYRFSRAAGDARQIRPQQRSEWTFMRK